MQERERRLWYAQAPADLLKDNQSNASASAIPKLFEEALRIRSGRPSTVRLSRGENLLEMARDEFRHLEHAHLARAIKNRPHRIVGVNLRPLFLVLQSVFLDVIPKFFREFGAG